MWVPEGRRDQNCSEISCTNKSPRVELFKVSTAPSMFQTILGKTYNYVYKGVIIWAGWY